MAFIGNTNTTQAFTPAIDFFSGNGSTTAFTLSRPVASVAQVQVTIDNVAQNPSSAYTVSANTITFTSAPLSGTNNIYVYYTSPITQVIAPGQGTVTSESFGTITNFTTTGNTVLGDATTDTLTVGVTGIVKNASGNVGIGTASPTAKLTVNNATAADYLSLTTAGSTKGVLADEAGDLIIKSAASLLFQTNGSIRARLNTTGAFVLAGGTTTANGIGITFPATQSASSNANTLDDYEEGTYTPVIDQFTVSGTTTLTGSYTKIGNLVSFNVTFANTGTIAHSTSANITVPFSGGKINTGAINMWINGNGYPFNSNQSGTQLNTAETSFTRFFVGNFTTTSAGQQLLFAGTYRLD